MTCFPVTSMLRVHPGNYKNMDTIMKINFSTLFNNNLFTKRIYANHRDGIFVKFICGFLHAFQTLTKQLFPNVYISMITSNTAIKLKCWAIIDDTNGPLYYTMVSILQCPKTSRQIFVAKYLFLEQNKQISGEPLWSGHLTITDTLK